MNNILRNIRTVSVRKNETIANLQEKKEYNDINEIKLSFVATPSEDKIGNFVNNTQSKFYVNLMQKKSSFLWKIYFWFRNHFNKYRTYPLVTFSELEEMYKMSTSNQCKILLHFLIKIYNTQINKYSVDHNYCEQQFFVYNGNKIYKCSNDYLLALNSREVAEIIKEMNKDIEEYELLYGGKKRKIQTRKKGKRKAKSARRFKN